MPTAEQGKVNPTKFQILRDRLRPVMPLLAEHQLAEKYYLTRHKLSDEDACRLGEKEEVDEAYYLTGAALKHALDRFVVKDLLFVLKQGGMTEGDFSSMLMVIAKDWPYVEEKGG